MFNFMHWFVFISFLFLLLFSIKPEPVLGNDTEQGAHEFRRPQGREFILRLKD